MIRDRWPEIERVYHGALAHDPVSRSAWLDEACRDDAVLRQEVDSLIGYDAAAKEFLERSALQHVAEQLSADRARLAALQIPGYRILEVLGEGGMGVVYLAVQDAPLRRPVALKLIKPGMDSRLVVDRFETERQALARMDHPNIAAVFDAGTSADGRPYFVMEFVRGVMITEYCDRHRLSTRRRLDLFVQVCSAVQHAHQKGVIHRDLKPSNVLVANEDGRPRPKVIDFGIAKAISGSLIERAEFTEQGTLVGTPAYMSPEQAAFSRDIDTTTDVYSLGVLLYELLVGALPFDSKSLRAAGHDEMRRVIRESDPPKPSARLASTETVDVDAIAAARQTDAARLARHLRGDLDWITLKALEKDRRRRYPTAAALAADVVRYLTDRPVEARPPSAVYRIGKFARRYRAAVASAATILLVLVAGLSASLAQYARAERQRIEAERSRAQADLQRSTAESSAREAAAQRNAALSATADADRERAVATKAAASATDARREAEYRAYLATIAAASAELRANLYGPARDRLLAVSVELRGWEWHHLLLRTDTSLATLESTSSGCLDWMTRDGGRTWVQARYAPRAIGFPMPSDNALALEHRGASISLRRCRTLDRWDGGSNTPVAYEAGSILAGGPTGNVLSSIPGDGGAWELHLVTPPSNVASARFGPLETRPVCGAVSPDGRRIAVGLLPRNSPIAEPLDDIFEIWDVRAARRLARMLPARPPLFDTRRPAGCSATFSPDSILLATSGATVHVWRADTGVEVAWDATQAGTISQPIAFSPDGARLAIGRLTGLVDLLHMDDTRQVDHLDGNSLIRMLPLPDDERRLLVGQRKRNEVMSIAFSPDGKRIVTGADVNVGVWDTAQRVLIAMMAGHDAPVVGVAVAPDGHIVTGDAYGRVKLWPASLASAMNVVRGSFTVASEGFALSRDGSVAALTQLDGALMAWRLPDLSQVLLRTGSGKMDPESMPRSLAIGADGHQVLTGEVDAVGTVRTYALTSGESTSLPMNARLETGCESFGAPGSNPSLRPVGRMVLSSDGRSLAFSQGTDCVIVRDLPSMKTVATLHEHASTIAFRPDGLLVVMSVPKYIPAEKRVPGPDTTKIRIWDWRRSTIRAELPVPVVFANSMTAYWRFALSADGRRIALFDTSRRYVFIWDGDLTREIGRLAVPFDTDSVALSADGRRLATAAARDTTVRVWDADRQELLLTLTDDDVHTQGLAFTPDGRLIAGRASGGLTIWETRKGACAFCPPAVRRE